MRREQRERGRGEHTHTSVARRIVDLIYSDELAARGLGRVARETNTALREHRASLVFRGVEYILSIISNELRILRECRATRNQGNMNGDAGYRSKDNTRRIVPVETSDALVVQDNALIDLIQSRSSNGGDNQTNDRFKKDNRYHVVPPPLTRNYMPLLADLSFARLDDSVYRPIANKTSANWVSDDDDDDIFQSNDVQTTVKPSFKKIEFTKARNEPIKYDKQAVKPRMVTQSPKVDRKDWNGKMTQKLGESTTSFKLQMKCLIRMHQHMTENKSLTLLLSILMEVLVAFGGSTRGGKITVAKRKNRTLIEATRTMLAYSLLPIVFWAEAINTACYVLNRVLVTKPHNKTPYELIIGRAPSISFMRPFGCPVTILNTLDPLGKFDGKAEEGFLIGYSVNSKAFKVFNSQTRKVEENLHVNFLENKPNVAGQGPNWIFDIDSLTNSMNYQPVTARNQTNKNAGPQETNSNIGLKKNVDVGQTEEENVSTQQYIVFPLWSSISSNYKSSDDKANDDTVDDDACKKNVQEPASEYDQALKNVLDKMMNQEKEATEQSDAVRKEFEALYDSQLLQEKITRASSTNSFNTVSTLVNTASASRTFSPVGPSSGPSFVPFGGSFPIDIANLPHDPLMPELEDTAEIQSTGIFSNAYDDHHLETLNTPYSDQSVGAKADFNNMEPSTIVSPIPTTRVHSIHPKAQIIEDPKSAVQTRGMTKKNSGEHAMISYIQNKRRTNHKDFQNCLFACFLSQHEPTKISQALDDKSWVEAMRDELLQFKIQKV
ncbi:ribonuclease H-like domain-containing protein [Tanacetum coccineum]